MAVVALLEHLCSWATTTPVEHLCSWATTTPVEHFFLWQPPPSLNQHVQSHAQNK